MTKPKPSTAWQPGQSGNPAGRPKGNTAAIKAREAIQKGLPEIIETLMTQAKAGDVQAATALIDRVLPKIKPEAAPVYLNMTGDSVRDWHEVMQAVASGNLAVDRAAEFASLIAAQPAAAQELEGGASLEEVNQFLAEAVAKANAEKEAKARELALYDTDNTPQ